MCCSIAFHAIHSKGNLVFCIFLGENVIGVAPKRFTPFIQEETWYFLYFFKIDIVIANGRPTTITCIFS
jgi:hypothetical protein